MFPFKFKFKSIRRNRAFQSTYSSRPWLVSPSRETETLSTKPFLFPSESFCITDQEYRPCRSSSYRHCFAHGPILSSTQPTPRTLSTPRADTLSPSCHRSPTSKSTSGSYRASLDHRLAETNATRGYSVATSINDYGRRDVEFL